MGITERRIRQKNEIRTSILSTAWKIVKEEGWPALSIRKIADAIEYSVPVVYDHFENKEGILLEFSKQGFNLLVKKLQQAKKKSADPCVQLSNIADAYWDFAFKNKEYYQVMFGLGMVCCDFEKCLPQNSVFQELVMEPILSIISRNKRTDINACFKYHTFWSVLHGLISIKLVNNTDATEELNKYVLTDAIQGFIKHLEK
jgi:AcrR family transcriptional regulator